ncbi:MAG: hypothetical protein WDM91_15535 [Rhizomicrobium sp.]
MDRIPRADELSDGEMKALRDVITRSVIPVATVPKASRERLIALGLITGGMGLLMPTPAGRIVARMLQ